MVFKKISLGNFQEKNWVNCKRSNKKSFFFQFETFIRKKRTKIQNQAEDFVWEYVFANYLTKD